MKMALALAAPFVLMVATLSLLKVDGVSGVIFYTTLPSRNENNEVVYEYRYYVDEGPTVHDRWEQRVGQFVKGGYSLLEPTGMVRTVSYEVDGPAGFVAVVRTTFPAAVLQSTQQFVRAAQQFPEPEVNLRVGAKGRGGRGARPPRNFRPPAAVAPQARFNPAHSAQRLQQGFQNGFQGGGRGFRPLTSQKLKTLQ